MGNDQKYMVKKLYRKQIKKKKSLITNDINF